MARKYLCDNCGVEKDAPNALVQLWIERPISEDCYEGDTDHEGVLAELCGDCLASLKKIVKEGFSKGAA